MTSTADLVTDSLPDLTNTENKTSFWQMNFKAKISYIREIITVEPLITAYMLASYVRGPALRNLELEKACLVNLEYNDTVCEAVTSGEHENYTEHNNNIQVLISNMYSWQTPVQSIIPLILLVFLGSYSDRHKWRKPFLLLPILGEFFSVVACILCVVFMRTWSLEVLGLAQTVIPSFFGGLTMLATAAFAYIADVSTLEMRTLRVGVIHITQNICSPIIQLFSGILFVKIGYYGVLLVATAFYAFAIIYGFYWIKEPKPSKSARKIVLKEICDLTHVTDTFNLLLKKSPGNNRGYIIVLLITLAAYSGISSGEGGLLFLYVQKVVHWTVVELSYFLSVNTIVHSVGFAVGIPLFTKVLHLNDIVIIILTVLDKIIGNIIFTFANSNVLLYVAAVVSLIMGIIATAIRSFISKVVSENDLGKAQSLFSIFETIASSVASPVYNLLIYNNFITTFPAAFFVLGIIINVICCLCLIWMYIDYRRHDGKIITEEPTDKSVPMESYVQTTPI